MLTQQVKIDRSQTDLDFDRWYQQLGIFKQKITKVPLSKYLYDQFDNVITQLLDKINLL
jgi:hypothetical protein